MFPFRFDAEQHQYLSIETGEVFPHITQMLEDCGLVDSRWYTDAARTRGSCVHRLTSDYDLGSIVREDLPQVNSIYKGWLAAHVWITDKVKPRWLHVEEPRVHPQFRYGGRPDRVSHVYGALAVVEIKSGEPEDGHAIQLALQAILVAPELKLPAETIPRYALYLKGTGKGTLTAFPNTRRDFAKAREIIRRCC